ncbi:hypothetical protein E2P81_ATG10279 [Venturia nashicola]|nr:hypothetical protein E2P81_ATG10279 [Venturia nashicola]
MSDPPPAKKPSGLSLYGDLIAPRGGGVISAGPVRYDMKAKESEPEAQKKKNAAYQFTPAIKRPVQKKGKSKTPSSFGARPPSVVGDAVGASAAGTSSPDKQLPSSTPQQPSVGPGLTYQDIVNNVDEDEDEELYMNHKPKWQGRGGRKHKNKKNKRPDEEDEVDWDAIYDPAKPSNLARYQGSTEQDAERAEWTHFVHWHRDMANKHPDVQRPKPRNNLFAPPANLSFAPPVFNEAPSAGNDPMDIDDDEYYLPPAGGLSTSFDRSTSHQPAAPAIIPQDATGDDAYMRRLRLSGMAQQTSAQGTPEPVSQQVASTAPPATAAPPGNLAAQMAAAKAKLAAAKAKIDAQHAQGGLPSGPSPTPPVESTTLPPSLPPPPQSQDPSMIIKAPVRYQPADAQEEVQSGTMSTFQAPAALQPASKVSGQKGFAARLMAKMGWEEGQGLGAKGEGITTAIIAQPTKRKRRSDKEGGGWRPATGKIVGGKKRNVQSTDDDEGEFGNISSVVKLQGMLDELDVGYEIEENNLQQEIGEKFSKDYGTIERLFIWREENGGNNEVFVKFTNQLSALKACGGTNEMTFAGNPVKARFFDAAKFENGEYA